MSLLAVLGVAALLSISHQGAASDMSKRILQIRNVGNSEANLLLEDIVSREMKDCSLLIAFDGHHSLIPLAASLIRHHPKGLGLLDITEPSVSGTLLKVRKEFDSLVCHGLLVLVHQTSWKTLMELGLDAWAGLARIFFVIHHQKNITVDVVSLLSDPSLRFTLHAAAAVKGGKKWSLYSNDLFAGPHRQTAHSIDSWSPQDGFRGYKTLFDAAKMSDLRGYDFAVAALPYSPFIMAADGALAGPGKYKGLEVLLLDVLAEAANFTYHYVAPADGEWGRLKPSGVWTGMIGMVTTEKADWAVSDITFSPQREEYVDFCKPFIYDASELVTPKAKLLPQWLGPVRPLSLEVWIGVVVMVAFSGPFLWFLAKLFVGSEIAYVKYFQEIGNAIMYILQPVFQKGHPNDVRDAPGRLFYGTWLIFTMIIGILYSSSLTSFLVFPGYQKPIENLQQLVKSDIGWGKVNFGGIQNAILEQTQDPVLIALREGVQWRSSLDDILQDVVKGTLATWDNSITTRLTIAVKFTDSSGQPLVHLPGFELLQERIAWPMQQHAPYKQRFDKLISRVVQAGLVQKWLKQLIFEEQALARKKTTESSESKEYVKKSESDQVVLSLAHFQGPFFVLFLGYLVGAVALILEVAVAVLFQSSGNFSIHICGLDLTTGNDKDGLRIAD